MNEHHDAVEAEVSQELNESRSQRYRLRVELQNLETALREAQRIADEMPDDGPPPPSPAAPKSHWRLPWNG